MKMKSICLLASVVIFVASSALAQNQQLATVPRLVQFSGTVKDSAGKPASGNVTLTFALYEDREGGAALWLESQDVQLDAKGHYTVLLGAATGGELPLDVFVSGAARWLGVQPGLPGFAEQPRVLLVGVPYALKASDADTLGGKPASAYLLAGAATPSASPSSAANIFTETNSSPAPSSDSVQGQAPTSLAALPVNNCNVSVAAHGAAISGYIPFWMGTANTCTTYLSQSNIFQASNGNVGIGNTSPAGPLDLTGNAFIRGTLQLTSLGTATSTGGFNSNTLDFLTSSFKAGGAAVNQLFRWQAEPVGNNTSSPSGKFNLLFGSGTGTPAETGLSIASTGIIGFVNTQPFGNVTPGTGLKGGGTVAFGVPITLTVDESVVAFQSDLTAGIQTAETAAQGYANTAQSNAKTYTDGQISNALQTAQTDANTAQSNAKAYTDGQTSNALVAAQTDANTAQGNAKTYTDGQISGALQTAQTDANTAQQNAEIFAAGLLTSPQTALSVATISTASTISSGSTYQIGGSDVLKADKSKLNTATGLGALASSTTASENDAHGNSALGSLTTGIRNAAHGKEALKSEISGNNNVANGHQALKSHTQGDDNTAIGTQSGMNLLTGTKNILLGKLAGQNLKGSESKEILINHDGVTGESNTVRIGNDIDQIQTFIAGVYEKDHSQNTSARHVLIDTVTGQLGIDPNAAQTSISGITAAQGLTATLGPNGVSTIAPDTNYLAKQVDLTQAKLAAEAVALGYAQTAQAASLSLTTGGKVTAAVEAATLNSDTTLQIQSQDVLKADANFNTITGFQALSNATTAAENDAHGYNALMNLTTGIRNAAHGKEALKSEISGNNNVANGHQALKSHTQGDDNTAIGTQSGMNLLTGTKNILIGKLAGQNLTSSESKEILINHDGVTSENNTIHIGNDIDQTATYIAGVYETDHSTNPNAVHVLIDKKTGKLGVDNTTSGSSGGSISTGPGLLVNGGAGPVSGAATLTVDTTVIATNTSVTNAVGTAVAALQSFATNAATTAATNAVSSYLPLSGGTLTGSLTGTTANFGTVTSAGVVSAPAVISAGPTFTSNLGCNETSLTGGATAGSFTSGTGGTSGGTCTLTITMGNSVAAPNGWACHANDLTTNADSASWSQTATTTTTVTLSGTTLSGDVVNFACIGY